MPRAEFHESNLEVLKVQAAWVRYYLDAIATGEGFLHMSHVEDLYSDLVAEVCGTVDDWGDFNSIDQGLQSCLLQYKFHVNIAFPWGCSQRLRR